MALVALPDHILHAIALDLALSADARGPVGPPSPLIPLLCTSKALNSRLSWRAPDNDVLYFSIFKSQFDITASRRRFGSDIQTAPFLAEQLRKSWRALRRLKIYGLNSDHLLDDFWEAYVLITENDGRNIHQVLWAGVHELAERFVMDRLWDGAINGWPQDSPINALAVWLLWSTMDERA
jgi:hypothetical protein